MKARKTKRGLVLLLIPLFASVGSSFLFPSSPFEQPIFANGPCDGTLQELDQSTRAFEEAILDRIPRFAKRAAQFIAPVPRKVTVWLPPGYHNSSLAQSYPVLYCHDGQNVVSDSESWTGHSWRLTGALCSLVRRNLLEPHQCPIVVLIPSSVDDYVVPFVRRRHVEYESSLLGQTYVDIVANTIKPMVDSQFRTLSSPEHTMTIGSSMGGQVALQSALRHPNKFGGAAALSPFISASVLADLALMPAKLRSKKIYIDNGGDIDDIRVPLLDVLDHIPHWNPGYFWLDTQLQPGIDAARAILDFHRVPYKYAKFPGGRHNERAWAMRIDKPLLYLFGDME